MDFFQMDEGRDKCRAVVKKTQRIFQFPQRRRIFGPFCIVAKSKFWFPMSVRPYVCLSVCVTNRLSACISASHTGRIFAKFYIGGLLRKFVNKLYGLLISDKKWSTLRLGLSVFQRYKGKTMLRFHGKNG
jgi:hypothetical protein